MRVRVAVLLFSQFAFAENLDELPASPPVANPRLRPDDMGSFLDPRGSTVRVRRRRGKKRLTETRYYGRLHLGIDVVSLTGDRRVFAIRGGKVVYRGELTRALGYTVILQHEDSYMTVYAHLDRGVQKLKLDSTVRRGEQIGNMGASGNARETPYPYQVHIEVIHASRFVFAGKQTLKRLRKQSLRAFGIETTPPLALRSVASAVPHSENVFIYCPYGSMHCTCPHEHGSFCHEFDKTKRCKY